MSVLQFEMNELISSWKLTIHGQAPFFAGPPPTIRLVATVEFPHPSSEVSKRPLISGFSGSLWNNIKVLKQLWNGEHVFSFWRKSILIIGKSCENYLTSQKLNSIVCDQIFCFGKINICISLTFKFNQPICLVVIFQTNRLIEVEYMR